MAGWLIQHGRIRWVAVLVASVIGAVILESIIKTFIARPGPVIDSADLGIRTFPSGHTTVGVTLFLAGGYLISKTVKGRVRGVVICASGMCALGVVLSALTYHFPSEVLGGVALSGAWLAVLLPISMSLPDARSSASTAMSRQIASRTEKRLPKQTKTLD